LLQLSPGLFLFELNCESFAVQEQGTAMFIRILAHIMNTTEILVNACPPASIENSGHAPCC